MRDRVRGVVVGQENSLEGSSAGALSRGSLRPSS